MNKKSLNPNIRLSEGNIKSQCNDKIIFLTWSLPSGITCPYATAMCRKRCFAKKNENFENVRVSRNRNLEESRKDTFVNDMIEHFKYHLQREKFENKNIFVRIHTSGDFYNLEYLKKWIDISNHFRGNSRILFQCYTKSMPILEKIDVNNFNVRVVWSIWDDTPEEYTMKAKSLGLQTFKALPNSDIQKELNLGAFLCNGDCGNCKECYTGTSKNIVIQYH